MPLKTPSYQTILKTSLAMFSLIFGAGNIIYPVFVGTSSGTEYLFFGLLGFCITTILVPLLGVVSIILFDGNYEEFFGRLGKIPGNILIFICLLILGPLVATPRMVTLSYITVNELIPTPFPLFVFIFLFIVFSCLLLLRRF